MWQRYKNLLPNTILSRAVVMMVIVRVYMSQECTAASERGAKQAGAVSSSVCVLQPVQHVYLAGRHCSGSCMCRLMV